MQSMLWDKVKGLLPPAAVHVLPYVLLAVAAAIVLWIVWRVLHRQKRAAPPLSPDLRVEVASLASTGPPDGPPTLEFYNLPMRLAAVVLAPVGRARELPPDDQFAPLLDAIVPGLDKVAVRHQPVVRRWPQQVSVRGFAHVFFSNVRLPGDAGKGTPWSSVAGLFKVKGEPVMAGLVLCAARPNSLGQAIVDSEEKWLGCLRVKWR
jgi:hypothetical protein